ncbi:hypothetical protein ACFORG_07545 [Lutimaribacter marinistellae]|uniref:Regulatory protein SoxS n=1 Tax=Lutimaribacter marinistellae TaxID=1820329 RepID=A0ABV7TEB8_9RHOB
MKLTAIALSVAFVLSAIQVAAAELVMVEQRGCAWCERWNEEIAPAYPNTHEGKFAPLRRVDLRALPDDITLDRRVSFTPTFLIVENGEELARLEGYPGPDFFWPVLEDLLEEHTSFEPYSEPGS